jgi:hypothetical protein
MRRRSRAGGKPVKAPHRKAAKQKRLNAPKVRGGATLARNRLTEVARLTRERDERPGGNITGVTFLASTFGAKHIQLLHEAIPDAVALGILVNPFNPNAKAEMVDIQGAARTLGLQVNF